MMIDKEKTIKKAIRRYNYLFPVRGKHSISDCFFCLRGETFLIFRTKDQKIHKMKAETIRPSVQNSAPGREVLDTIFKVMNKPIIVRSLIVKKPVKACLINLFPVPAITWSANTVVASDTSGHVELTRSSTNSPVSGNSTGTASVPAAAYPPAAVRQGGISADRECTYSDLDCYIIRDITMCQYEVLATGCLPISQFTDILPTPEETPPVGRGMNAPGFEPGRWNVPADRFTEPGTSLPMDTTIFRYEVLAPGYLHKRPRPEWKTISNSCVAGYVHDRSSGTITSGTVPRPVAALQNADPDCNRMTW